MTSFFLLLIKMGGNNTGSCGSLRNREEMWRRNTPSLVGMKTGDDWAHRSIDAQSDIWNDSRRTGENQGGGDAVPHGKSWNAGALRSGLTTRMSLVRSGISRILGFPSKSAYFAFWKKLFLFDIVANVARVGGSLFLYVFAPQLYQLLPGGLVG